MLFRSTQFSRAYVRHLFKAGEILALRLLSFQNLEFYLRLMAQARDCLLYTSEARHEASILPGPAARVVASVLAHAGLRREELRTVAEDSVQMEVCLLYTSRCV